ESRPYFVMEYLEGETLADVLARAGAEGLPVDVAVGFGRQLCEALEAVHGQGIIHRDIKPGNVIVTASTTAVLMDFGLARKEVTARRRGPGAELVVEVSHARRAVVRTSVSVATSPQTITNEMPVLSPNGPPPSLDSQPTKVRKRKKAPGAAGAGAPAT